MPDFVFAKEARAWTALLSRTAPGTFAPAEAVPEPLGRAIRDETDGMPFPALRLRGGRWRLCWPVDPGSREFSVWCKHPRLNPRPRVRIVADPALGVQQDVIVEAQDTADWHKLSATIQATAQGVLVVYLENRAPFADVLWDTVSAG